LIIICIEQLNVSVSIVICIWATFCWWDASSVAFFPQLLGTIFIGVRRYDSVCQRCVLNLCHDVSTGPESKNRQNEMLQRTMKCSSLQSADCPHRTKTYTQPLLSIPKKQRECVALSKERGDGAKTVMERVHFYLRIDGDL